MPDEVHVHDLEKLAEIAETINSTYEMEPMLDRVLEKLLEVTGLETGWVFLFDREREHYRCAADLNLPSALSMNGKQPMRQGGCWCVDRFRDGRLKKAINILNCKRLEDAVACKRGDTRNITHHATIPLRSGDDLFGILNVASPGKTVFSEEELALLQAVALQIGTAAHRIRLYAQERKRADLFERLGKAARQLSVLNDSQSMPADIVRCAGESFGWRSVALVMREAGGDYLRALYHVDRVECVDHIDPIRISDETEKLLARGRCMTIDVQSSDRLSSIGIPIRYGAAIPLVVQGRHIGALIAGGGIEDPFDAIDMEVLESFAAHVSLSYENARLYEQSKALARWEERNRIARDLHDSVSQMLFALQLRARGMEAVLKDEPEGVKRGIDEIGQLARNALKEMRSMIRQLRPSGLEEGLLTGLTRYGEQIGLKVAFDAGELRQFAERVEEALLRIGQEALNNIKKHAGCDRAFIQLESDSRHVRMIVSDEGKGLPAGRHGSAGYGMSTMRERAEAVDGTLHVQSRDGGGTDVIVSVPLQNEG